jgi:hypothetical protein
MFGALFLLIVDPGARQYRFRLYRRRSLRILDLPTFSRQIAAEEVHDPADVQAWLEDVQAGVGRLLALYFNKLAGRQLPNMHNHAGLRTTHSRKTHAWKLDKITYSFFYLQVYLSNGYPREQQADRDGEGNLPEPWRHSENR